MKLRLDLLKHLTTEDVLEEALANKLFELVTVKKKAGVEVTRTFSDYEVTIGKPPAGVEIIELI